MALIDAYDKRTGDKLPHRVTEALVEHPVLGKHLAKTPRQSAADRKTTPTRTTNAPAAGDKE